MVFAILVGGCRQVDDEIRVYRVPKQSPRRMLAAMIPHGQKTWIFKVSGPDRQVAEFESQFEAFLKTIRFGEASDAEPQWELPERWGTLPEDHARNKGSFPRFATIYKPDENLIQRLEIAVSSLPRQPGLPWDFDVKRNIMRWRGQLGLPDVPVAQLDSYVSELKISENTTATLVKLFEGEAPIEVAADSVEAVDDPLPFTYEKPDSWPVGPRVPFSLLGFKVADGDRSVIISVTPAGGGLLANVNRWRGQLSLPSLEQDQLDDQLRKLKAGNVTFEYVQMVGADRTILAAIAEREGQTWFVTLKGDKKLAERETDNFEAFVKSMRFRPDGAEDGE